MLLSIQTRRKDVKILSIESGSMCKHQESSEQSGSYTTLQFLVAEQNPMWNKIAVLSTRKKEKIIVQRRRGFSTLLFPPPSCQKQGKYRDRNSVNPG